MPFITMPFKLVSISPTIAFNKDAFPNRRRLPPAGPTHSAWQNKPSSYRVRFSLRKLLSAISGFRSLCGREQHSSGYCAQWTCVLEPLLGPALASRALVSTRTPRGDRCRGRNVVAPGEYSKRFFCVPMGLYRGIFRPATALGMPARSALGALAGARPSAVIRPSIWPLCPCPASTTRAAPGARRRAACGISAR